MQNIFCHALRRGFFFFAAVIISSSAVYAQGTVQPIVALNAFPPSLIYKEKPVEPLCFLNQLSMEGESDKIDLRKENCTSEAYKELEYFSNDPYTVGVSYLYAGEEFPGMRKPYLMIQYGGPIINEGTVPLKHPPLDADIPVIIRYSGGGTGQFSTLYKMRRIDDHTLQIVETLSGGDRCNSGITEAFIDQEGKLNYGLNLTPYTMVLLGGKEDREFMSSIAPYEDLDDCASCCYGQADYKETELVGVSINERLTNMLSRKIYSPEARSEHTKQICFDDMIESQLQSGHIHFNPDDWHNFIREVEYTCLGREEGK